MIIAPPFFIRCGTTPFGTRNGKCRNCRTNMNEGKMDEENR
jgi:hypothetical protein